MRSAAAAALVAAALAAGASATTRKPQRILQARRVNTAAKPRGPQVEEVEEEETEGNGTHPRDLVFMHVPYNFGHTVEKLALFKKQASRLEVGAFIVSNLGGFGNHKGSLKGLWQKVNHIRRPGGMAWGHFNPDLNAISDKTGCSLYYTPQKYWPEDVAKKYFRGKKVFGLLRDPYERLVSMFRGSMQLNSMNTDYGSAFNKKYQKTCDVNMAIKEAMQTYLKTGDKFMSSCTFLPQVEFFEGPYGISIPVDNRHFPKSANTLLEEHGYQEMRIDQGDIFHVTGCPDVWAGDLDWETKSLVKQVYARDFELICKRFGYCIEEENTCIGGVQQMCPKSVCKDPAQQPIPCVASLARFGREARRARKEAPEPPHEEPARAQEPEEPSPNDLPF